jgi:hypothetical protein
MVLRRLLRTTFLAALASAPGSAAAAEWTYTHTVGLPDIRQGALFELWVSDAQPANVPVRGLVSIFNYEGGAEMYADQRFRDWAASQNLGLLRHRMLNRDSQFTVAKTQSAADLVLGTALPQLAAQSGRAEIEHSGLLWTGLSQAGWAAIALGNFSESRTIGVLPIHDSTGARDPALATSTLGLGLPTMHLVGGQDNVNLGTIETGTLYAQTIVNHAASRRQLGSLTAIAVQRNTSHTQWAGRTASDVTFMQDWMSEVVRLRVPNPIVPGQPQSLTAMDVEAGFAGNLGLVFAGSNPFVTVTSATLTPISALTTPATQQWWLPRSYVAQSWREYNALGRSLVIPEPGGALALSGGAALVLRRRRGATV